MSVIVNSFPRSPAVKRAACSHARLQMSINGGRTTVIADSLWNLARRGSPLALIIDCSDPHPRAESDGLVLPPGYEHLAVHYVSVPRIAIPWPDFSAPNLTPDFWPALVESLPEGIIGIGCQGGHGRTGTALVAVRMVAFGESFLTALQAIRDTYCHEAVESMAQRVYLRDVGIALGTTPESQSPYLAPIHDQPRTISEAIALTRSARDFDDWRAERDDAFASLHMPADDTPAPTMSKRQQKREARRAALERAPKYRKAGLE